MKNFLLVVGALLLLCIMSVQGYTQQEYTVVYDLYYNLTVYPENADELIRRNQRVFGGRFHSCLDRVQERAAQASREHMAYCNTLADPRSRAACAQEDEGGKFWTWARTVRSATRGEVRWSDTAIGQASLLAKREMGPARYEKIVQREVPKRRCAMRKER